MSLDVIRRHAYEHDHEVWLGDKAIVHMTHIVCDFLWFKVGQTYTCIIIKNLRWRQKCLSGLVELFYLTLCKSCSPNSHFTNAPLPCALLYMITSVKWLVCPVSTCSICEGISFCLNSPSSLHHLYLNQVMIQCMSTEFDIPSCKEKLRNKNKDLY